jgi:hypothetical protein
MSLDNQEVSGHLYLWAEYQLGTTKVTLQDISPKLQCSLLTTSSKADFRPGRQWLTPVILVIQEAEIKRIGVRSQPRANSSQDPSSEMLNIKRGCRVAQGVAHLPSKLEA